MAKNAAILLFCLISLTACGGRSPADLQRTLGYVQQMDTQGRPVMDLASQNRLSMQRNTPFSYMYTAPNSDEDSEEASTSSPTAVDTDDLLPGNTSIAPKKTLSDKNTTQEEVATEEDTEEAFSEEVTAEASPVREAGLPQATAFRLEDLKGKTQSFSFPRTKLLILAIADQKGSEDMENWIKPLYDRYTGSVEIQGVAELSAVPKFARGIARGIISGMLKQNQAIMLDWTGEVSSQFGAKAGVTNVYIINTQGQIIASGSGAASLDKLKAIAESVDNAL